MSITNYRPANNKVLVFKELGDLRRSIEVFSTADPNKFKVIRGLNARNQCIDTTYQTVEDLKRLWIDCSVNGYTCVANEIFPRGIIDCMSIKKPDPLPVMDTRGNFVDVKPMLVDERAEILVPADVADQ